MIFYRMIPVKLFWAKPFGIQRYASIRGFVSDMRTALNIENCVDFLLSVKNGLIKNDAIRWMSHECSLNNTG